ncbi:PAS domain-containing sensor histidine kinase [Paenibacillus kobensis]|uniref:PAS domain-containing sensor histidine kinase n=1 Tax=Paenibacillus kobensis TaxID=59841 RepID=UPI000FDB6001|nr:PAS domain-containing sensor histidine kinase [Paenibacillus kobensis]
MSDAKLKPSDIIAGNVETLLQQLGSAVENAAIREELKQSLKQLADLKFALDESSIVAVTDRKGKIQFVNDKFCEISKYTQVELIGQDHRIINSGYHDAAFFQQLWTTISAGQVWRGDIRNRAKDGGLYWVNTTIVPFVDQDGVPYQFLAIRNEVTELKRAEEELKMLMKQMMQIQEEERKRFSRELHDGIGQSLFSLLIQVDRMLYDKQDDHELKAVRSHVSQIIEDIRGLAWELRPSVLDDLGVVPAIRTYIDNYSEHYGIRVQFDSTLRTRLQPEKETAIYRIIQESLTNIGKYANVDEAFVTIHATPDQVEVSIRDYGTGFDPVVRSKGVGLFSMEERARICGGKLAVASGIGKGTEITFVLPSYPA